VIEMLGGPHHLLDEEEVRTFVRTNVSGLDLDGRSLCLVIPDGTRNCPLPLLLEAVQEGLGSRPRDCKAVIALGTHAPMGEAATRSLVGPVAFPTLNHAWWDEGTFVEVGVLGSQKVLELSGGLLDEAIRVRINRHVVESDLTLILGPVLPHEVVGFSGGNKYLFPGLSGQDLIDVTHWLGALITSSEIIGKPGTTPVRAILDAAAKLVPGERHALCVVVDHETGRLRSLTFGDPEKSWAAAADVSARTHVEYLDAPVRRVLSLVPPRYPDLWTGAKGFYKVEPVVADGGEVVLFAPHIRELAAMHPALAEIGYHCRDYFLAHWEQYRDYPRGDLAHSTHLFGNGTYDAVRGEHARVRVTLATGIPEGVVRRANLGYYAPTAVDVEEWETDPETLVVRDAGEVLYRLGSP